MALYWTKHRAGSYFAIAGDNKAYELEKVGDNDWGLYVSAADTPIGDHASRTFIRATKTAKEARRLAEYHREGRLI